MALNKKMGLVVISIILFSVTINVNAAESIRNFELVDSMQT